MKKILKLTLAFAMILVSLFGLTTLLAVNVPAVHLDVELISSDNIVAKVSIPEGFDIGGWKIELTYDGDKLVMEENPTDNDEVGVVNFGASGNRIIATQASITPYQNETEIYDVTFSLKESASFDENTITITSWRIADTSATVLSSSNDTDTVVHINCLHAVTSSKVTKEATCTEAGEETTVCSLCGEIISTKEIATLGHDIGEWIITKQPTCTEKGVESRECSRCHEILETREIDTIIIITRATVFTIFFRYVPRLFARLVQSRNIPDSMVITMGMAPVVSRSTNSSVKSSLSGNTVLTTDVARHTPLSSSAMPQNRCMRSPSPTESMNKANITAPSVTIPLVLPCVTRVPKPRPL